MLINLDDCEGMDMRLCQLAEEKHLTDEQFIYFTKGWQALWGMIIELPSADRPQGKWVDKGNWMGIECSRCKCHSRYVTPFCPQCGASMRGDKDE